MRLPWRTTFGLVASVSLVMTLITVTIGLTAYRSAHEAIERQLDHRISIETQMLLDEVGEGGLPELIVTIRQRDDFISAASMGYLLVDRDGRRLAGKLDAQPPAVAGVTERLRYDRGTKVAQATTTVLPTGERMVVAADRQEIDQIDRTISRLFAAAIAAMLVVGAGSSWLLGSLVRSRLHAIDKTARAIIAGDLRQRISVDGSGSEFDRVATTLNQMLDRIGALLENLRQVSSDVAHDLRTPLTRLRNRLHEAREATDGPARVAAIDAASGQAQELLELFAALLRISEIEAGALRAKFQPVRLDDLVADIVESFRPDAEISGHSLVLRIASDVRLQGDPRLLRQLLANLLDNALRHTPAGTRVDITLSRDGTGIVLVIEDDGPGVSAEAAPRLFERFTRMDPGRSTSGHGLGLALVAAITEMHGGGAAIENAPGFRVVMRFA